MSNRFTALVADDHDGKVRAEFQTLTLDALPDNDVLVRVGYSTLNYKDGLAVTGKGRICRSLPMVCGIDLAGTVESSRHADFQPGDRVLVNGYGLSETHWGGYSQYARLQPEWLVRVPAAFSLEQAMAIGTAGYTAMLCVLAIEDHGIRPEHGPVLVTGAAGGVGSVAVHLLAQLGYEVEAASGRAEAIGEFLKDLGATGLLAREALARDSKPLEKERWAAAVDCVGGQVLATALAQIRYEGLVAACGLAGGTGLPTTVMPFILRGVTLRGIDSVMAGRARRQRAWDRLAELVDLKTLARISHTEPMSKLPELAEQILAGQIQGRVVIDVNA
ncbi:MAG: MDR family oxidoreductase [Spongiibacteraceae bacterium]|jgi:acrylyl-CoA reductase (NADPH)|nr:MDR family oxidoreductase [Spongiibacteraceae bacterium]